jgi:hypothetical protein
MTTNESTAGNAVEGEMVNLIVVMIVTLYLPAIRRHLLIAAIIEEGESAKRNVVGKEKVDARKRKRSETKNITLQTMVILRMTEVGGNTRDPRKRKRNEVIQMMNQLVGV